MRIWLWLGMLVASTVAAHAQVDPVPEIDAFRDWLRWALLVQSQRSSGSVGEKITALASDLFSYFKGFGRSHGGRSLFPLVPS
jgi:hypothetical protein